MKNTEVETEHESTCPIVRCGLYYRLVREHRLIQHWLETFRKAQRMEVETQEYVAVFQKSSKEEAISI